MAAFPGPARQRRESRGAAGYRAVFHGGYVDVVKVRAREAADRAAAEGFLGRHGSLRVARLGELVHPLDHPAFVAETAGGRLAGMLTYVPGQDWQQCEILTLHAGEQWHGAGTALIEAVEQLAVQHRCTRLWVITTNDNVDALRFYSAAASAWCGCTAVPLIAAMPASSRRSPRWAPTGSRCVTRSSWKDNPEH